jgi:hypothetical protein
MSKVKIELTAEQRDQLRQETGDDFQTFTFEALENRDAPKLGGTADFTRLGEGRLYRGGDDYFVRVNPS